MTNLTTLSNDWQLPYSFARQHGVILDRQSTTAVTVFFRSDISLTSLNEVRRVLDQPVHWNNVNDETFDQLLRKVYEQGGNRTMQAMEAIDEQEDLFQIAEQLPETQDLLDGEDEAPIIRLINALLTEAVKENASDIHVEPFENRLLIRFRVDGVLRPVLEPKLALAPRLVSRIKVMARLDIAEKRLPQDGRISLKIGQRAVDVRVSSIPSSYGERVVLRILDKQAGKLDLQQLGVRKELLNELKHLISKPHGIVLVTGPTGSGKTTTLYAALSHLNNSKRNILTVEDPVEYHLDGIGQTQVNMKVDMTFARGLRAILRQDPDVVMVGEIRDLETAQIAVQASLTGHLVFSTLHTNTAVGAITRLKDMGIESFLLASSVVGVLAQRLLRVLCDDCKEAISMSQEQCDVLGIEHNGTQMMHIPKGCERCNHIGYRGRTGIYELLLIDEHIRHLIHLNESEGEIEKYARTLWQGIRTDGINKVLSGETSLDELLRVTRED